MACIGEVLGLGGWKIGLPSYAHCPKTVGVSQGQSESSYVSLSPKHKTLHPKPKPKALKPKGSC